MPAGLAVWERRAGRRGANAGAGPDQGILIAPTSAIVRRLDELPAFGAPKNSRGHRYNRESRRCVRTLEARAGGVTRRALVLADLTGRYSHVSDV